MDADCPKTTSADEASAWSKDDSPPPTCSPCPHRAAQWGGRATFRITVEGAHWPLCTLASLRRRFFAPQNDRTVAVCPLPARQPCPSCPPSSLLPPLVFASAANNPAAEGGCEPRKTASYTNRHSERQRRIFYHNKPGPLPANSVPSPTLLALPVCPFATPLTPPPSPHPSAPATLNPWTH